MESPYPDSHLKDSSDEVLFYGVNSKSECLLVRVARGRNGNSEAWIYLKLADGRTFHLSETVGHQQPSEGNTPANFTCGRLQMHYLAPMRRWRVAFCGMLRESSQSVGDTDETFVKFVFVWRASYDVYDFTLDTNPWKFADAMARCEWKEPFRPPLQRLISALNFYAQSGVMNGEVSINDGPNYEMYLFGERIRNLGKITHMSGSTFMNILGSIPEIGCSFHIGKATIPNLCQNLPYGYVIEESGMYGVLKQSMVITKKLDGRKSMETLKVLFSSNGTHKLSGIMHEPVTLHTSQTWTGSVEMRFVEFTMGKKKGNGFFLTGEYNQVSKTACSVEHILPFPTKIPMTVQFTSEESYFGSITGGKGSSLGKLTKLSKEHTTFIVPKGLVVTTSAYFKFLTPDIQQAVKQLEDVVYGNVEGDVKTECSNVEKTIVNTELPALVSNSIMEDLEELFENNMNSIKVAIRSSATGEDTASMSAAGQMDTFLGVQGVEEIFLSVKKCWASQFGHIAVEYKKRNGQTLNSPMAVVIQEMVPCEVSGVLFTCDPVTNNPSVITITANYGLGESVVSGSAEPDTITFRKKQNGKLQFHTTTIGSKKQRVVMKDDGGTTLEEVEDSSQQGSCLTQEMAERLATLSLTIEKYYKTSSDIEFGILGDNIYILQSRPVTNICPETEHEMKHEFDDHMRCEDDYYTGAISAEILPLAVSPLGIDLVVNFFSNELKRESIRKGISDIFMQCKYYASGMFIFSNHLMGTVTEMLVRFGYRTLKSKGFEIGIFGRELEEPDLLAKVQKRHGNKKQQHRKSLKQHLSNYWYLFFHDWKMSRTRRNVDHYNLKFMKTSTATDCFRGLLNSCSDFDDTLQCLLDGFENSSTWNMHMLQILIDANGKLDTDVYSDFARLLATSSNVESAEVPKAMQEVSIQIAKDISSEEFKSMSIEAATNWFNTTKSLSGHMFRKFLERHGHRCLNEFDVHAVTWGTDPKLLVKLLQNLTGLDKEFSTKKNDDFDTIFKDMNIKLSFISKLKLRFVLPLCRRGVRSRETGKSCTIKGVDHWRKGYTYLGKLMASEGRLPDQDLIFFLTIDEIDDLLNTRSSSIISRASSRRKVFPKIERYKFPLIMKGLPRPLNDEDESADTYEFVADLAMTGIPVSQGVAKGYARVAVSLEEAAQLKSGEILLTYSTDIGWSPYFPIISGLVTELGGLISHGAVVSREYGLPCVVGVAGVTKRFQTGDYVLLDGKRGILQRLPKPEN